MPVLESCWVMEEVFLSIFYKWWVCSAVVLISDAFDFRPEHPYFLPIP